MLLYSVSSWLAVESCWVVVLSVIESSSTSVVIQGSKIAKHLRVLFSSIVDVL